mgnify:FL=1
MRMAWHIGRVAAAWLLLAILSLGVLADPASAGPPQVAKGRGDKCVAETGWMRRNHMSVLKHQRDGTVHEGLRTSTFSLKGCVDCHAVKGDDGKAVTVADPKHFCRTCHDYAAVKLDCFECHASRPEGAAMQSGAAGADPHNGDVAALSAYLKEVQR